MTREQHWFPSEVVELTAYVPDARGFLPATALLMIDALESGDGMANMESRWGMMALEYLALPPAVAVPLLKGFRHLYEAVDHWFECWHVGRKKPRREPVTIPLLCEPFGGWRRGEIAGRPQ